MTKSDLIVASYVYDAWGNILYQEGSYAEKNPYRYAGYTYDKETGHYYLMARYYNPAQGVFTSMDPDPGDDDDILTQNGYTYANNNPVMVVDPDGHYVWAVVNAGFAVYDGYKAYKAGKKSGKKGWALAGSVALAAGSSFVKVGHIKKAGKMLGAVHKNSNKSKALNHGYHIIDTDTGKIVKIGISATKINSKGKSPRAERQVSAWNKNNPGKYQAVIQRTNIRGRSRAKQWEKASVNRAYRNGNFDLNANKHKRPMPN